MENQESKYKNRKMTLSLDDNTTEVCKVIDVIEFEGKRYIAMVNEDESRAFMYEYCEDEDGSFELNNIDDKDTFKKVEDIFYNMLEE